MKKEKNEKKSRLETRLDKQGEKLRENLKKRLIWQEEHDKWVKEQEEKENSHDAENQG